MRIFVTGASGYIGSAVVPELIAAGHQVVGLARSDASAAQVSAAGAEAHRGSLDDPDTLHAGAAAADGVIHLAYNHDFTQPQAAAETDRRAIEAIGSALVGSNKALVVTSGLLGVAQGRMATEEDQPDEAALRGASSQLALSFAGQGVRSSLIRLARSVHGLHDPNFLRSLVRTARERGVSAYVGEGRNRWTGVHRLDAARLFRLALETAPAGSILHGVGDEGVPLRTIAEVIGRHLGLPTTAVPAEGAQAHFGPLSRFLTDDSPASSLLTRARVAWQPQYAGLIADLEQGHYFRESD